MLETITATYNSSDQIRNAWDDLINTGNIPRDKIYMDEDGMVIKVMVNNAIKPEIQELLQRHNPLEIHDRPVS